MPGMDGPLSYAHGQQGASGAGGFVPELAVGGAVVLVAHHQRLAAAVLLDGGAEVVADGLAQQRRRAGAVGVGEGAVHARHDRTDV